MIQQANRVLIVGLGNIGPRYNGTRHNCGFMAIDQIALTHSFPAMRANFHGICSSHEIDDFKITLLKPQTYMNLSGTSVQAACNFFKIPTQHVIVIHDDMEVSLGLVKTRVGGSARGHNGLKSIGSYIGNEYTRVRIGIGRPSAEEVDLFVLGKFTQQEADTVAECVHGIAMNLMVLLGGRLEEFSALSTNNQKCNVLGSA